MENIYVYFAAFRRVARKANWSEQRIEAVFYEAMGGDYDNAVSVLLAGIEEAEGKLDTILL